MARKNEGKSGNSKVQGVSSARGCCPGVDRRDFVKTVGLSAVMAGVGGASAEAGNQPFYRETLFDESGPGENWPSFKQYPQEYLSRIALPLGGIGTGTVSLGGRGDLRDWEIMNRPAKKYIPHNGEVYPCFILYTEVPGKEKKTRLLEGPIEYFEYEGSHGSRAANENLPRFRSCRFDTAYPFGRVHLDDPAMPVRVAIKAFNPLIPADVDSSSIPVACITYEITNKTSSDIDISVCGSLPNHIGIDGWKQDNDWKGDPYTLGAKENHNRYREGRGFKGVFMTTEGVPTHYPQWGTMALTTDAGCEITFRTAWEKQNWGNAWLDFWEDFSDDGLLDERPDSGSDSPTASLAAKTRIAAGSTEEITFYISWHFPNRYSWSPKFEDQHAREDFIGNYYTGKSRDAWDVAEKFIPRKEELETGSREFVTAFLGSDLPDEVKEAALFNISTHRTQVCFRTPDGRFFGFEGAGDKKGCCIGSCTHVWNYEQATSFLYGELASSMREIEFMQATDEEGLMSFRVHLPIERAREWGKAAADGQMGCIMKIYRDWQLSGDDEFLRKLWPKVKKALAFAWIKGGWDADQDGVMEGAQHNTMDVEYYGPNPQMGIWYLGALKAAVEMAGYLGDTEFADKCGKLFSSGSRWIDANLFNGEYYEHLIQLPKSRDSIAPSLMVGMGAENLNNPDYQLGKGCLIDQLVGQYMAHVCGLGYLVKPENVRKTLESIRKYNHRSSFEEHFNCLRSFVLGDEAGLLMASYPGERPEFPFPYFTEVMTGFEYTAAIGMLYEGLTEDGLSSIRDIRARYNGRRRSPFNEAECGNHYSRAMASWAAVLALTGFDYSAVERKLQVKVTSGKHFWSNGYSWGQILLSPGGEGLKMIISVKQGNLKLSEIRAGGFSYDIPEPGMSIKKGQSETFELRKNA
jgi:uncharacterized protein (DUF608 family)